MKIALISFEYPPDTAYGGIATYAFQMTKMMANLGHHVEVFSGSKNKNEMLRQSERIVIHRVKVHQRIDFIKAVVPVFSQRHQLICFDVIEGPEYGADAAGIIKKISGIPYVVKLHTPRFLVDKYDYQTSLISKIRTKIGALRRGFNPFRDIEYTQAIDADEVTAPSHAIGEEIIKRWKISPEKVSYIPLPYEFKESLLNISIQETQTSNVTFIGRLDIKKGILDLAEAIPIVLEEFPQAQFTFVGRNGHSPAPKIDMKSYLEKKLIQYTNSIEFTGQVPIDDIKRILSSTDVCIFPSRWESFGLVCLEAMAAGRAVVASNAGGMAEIIDSRKFGRLVPPQRPDKIAEAIIKLLQNPLLRTQIGKAARQRVVDQYNPERIGRLQEESYKRAISRRSASKDRMKRLFM